MTGILIITYIKQNMIWFWEPRLFFSWLTVVRVYDHFWDLLEPKNDQNRPGATKH